MWGTGEREVWGTGKLGAGGIGERGREQAQGTKEQERWGAEVWGMGVVGWARALGWGVAQGWGMEEGGEWGWGRAWALRAGWGWGWARSGRAVSGEPGREAGASEFPPGEVYGRLCLGVSCSRFWSKMGDSCQGLPEAGRHASIRAHSVPESTARRGHDRRRRRT